MYGSWSIWKACAKCWILHAPSSPTLSPGCQATRAEPLPPSAFSTNSSHSALQLSNSCASLSNRPPSMPELSASSSFAILPSPKRSGGGSPSSSAMTPFSALLPLAPPRLSQLALSAVTSSSTSTTSRPSFPASQKPSAVASKPPSHTLALTLSPWAVAVLAVLAVRSTMAA
jgi:hypothetical protein